MKRVKCLLLLGMLAAVVCLVPGCRGGEAQYSRAYFEFFDTVVRFSAYAPNAAAFERAAEVFFAHLKALDAAFDGYEPHEGVSGLYALNASGGEWLAVEPELYDLLLKVRDWRALGGERVNPALGNLFALWKRYRDAGGGVPDADELRRAALNGDFAALELEDGRARLTDPDVRLDLGAVAKGYAAQRLAKAVSPLTPRFLIDAGGNIAVGDAPPGGVGAWRVGVRDPDGDAESLLVLRLTNASAVTSGDYQRYYEYEGVRYHHLIDPATLYPGRYMRQATVICADSGWADYLSTLLFLTPPDEAINLAERLDGVEAILVLNDGSIRMTKGAEERTRD